MCLFQISRSLQLFWLYGTIVFLAFALLLVIGGLALAQEHYDNPNTAEGWAFALIKKGKEANFNKRCSAGRTLDPRAGDDLLWKTNCRRLEATFLVNILTKAPWHDQVPFAGVHVIGARIVGDIDLSNASSHC